MCNLCDEQPAFREAWDKYHFELAQMWITHFADHGGANEFSLRAPLLHLAYRSAWLSALATISPQVMAFMAKAETALAAQREATNAAFEHGRATGVEEGVRLYLARHGNQGTN